MEYNTHHDIISGDDRDIQAIIDCLEALQNIKFIKEFMYEAGTIAPIIPLRQYHKFIIAAWDIPT